jgi:predicted O-methyltransferase YrrM
MDFLPDKIEDYVLAHSQQEPKLLQKLNRETWQKVLQPRMLSGHFQGRVLSMISKLIAPMHVLEIGTYTGYSALCLAEGIQSGGTINTIDINEELHDLQRKYFDASGFGSSILQHTGNALDIIPALDSIFDLVFIDADKKKLSEVFGINSTQIKKRRCYS